MRLEALNLSTNNFRIRSEAVVYNKDGILCIYEDGYILFPGGGTDQGETPLQGVMRESIEEADTKLLDVVGQGKLAAVWDKENPLDPDYIGEMTHFFTAFNGGTLGTEHRDRENFEVKPFDEVLSFIKEVMVLPDQFWARQNNLKRIELVELARGLV